MHTTWSREFDTKNASHRILISTYDVDKANTYILKSRMAGGAGLVATLFVSFIALSHAQAPNVQGLWSIEYRVRHMYVCLRVYVCVGVCVCVYRDYGLLNIG
jgi:hypothetical protein